MPVLLWGSNPSSQDEQSCEYYNYDYDNIDDGDIHDGDDNDVTEDSSVMIFR